MSAGAVPPASRAPLYGPAFLALCVGVFLGFCCFSMVNPIIPVVILEAGGDAALVGLVVGIYSIPSVLLRPFMGRLVDTWSRWRVLALGATGLGLSTFLYLVPGLFAMAVVRLLNGASFAGFNTAGNASLAALAPPARRAEAAAIYNLMPSLAYMIAPATGLVLLGALGAGAAFVLAGLAGLAGALVIVFGPLRERGTGGPIGGLGWGSLAAWRNLLERRAVLPMAIETLWVSTNVLFAVFPPVWADARGIPVADLAIYYPVAGIALVASRVVVGRHLDRVPRGVAILAGVSLGCVAVLLAAVADSVAVLALAGAIFAFGSSAVSPTAAAIAIDRAEPARRGATMATYSMGFPLGNGIGALAWGAVIGALGFPVPFLVALGALGSAALLVWVARAELLGDGPSP